jgi:hypothetical protein
MSRSVSELYRVIRHLQLGKMRQDAENQEQLKNTTKNGGKDSIAGIPDSPVTNGPNTNMGPLSQTIVCTMAMNTRLIFM